jgi:hypothetical protein
MPGSRDKPNSLCRWPHRRSPSTSSTRDPANASVRARLAAMVDFPSLGIALGHENSLGPSAFRCHVK